MIAREVSMNFQISPKVVGMLSGILLLSSAMSSTAAPPPPPVLNITPPETAEEVVDRFIKVTGGRAAWESLRSLRALGRIEVPGAGIMGYLSLDQTRDGYRRAIDRDGVLAQVTIRRGEEAWTVNSGGEVVELRGEQRRKLVRDQQFNPLAHAAEIYSSMKLDGMAQVGESQAWLIKCEPRDDPGSSDWRYFDVESGLQIKVVERASGEAGGMPAELSLSDYRQVGDVKLPFVTHVSMGRGGVSIIMDAMQANSVIPSCLFDPPAGPRIEPPRKSPKEVVDQLMREEINQLTAAQCNDWIERLTMARADLEQSGDSNASLKAIIPEFLQVLAQRKAMLESGQEANQ